VNHFANEVNLHSVLVGYTIKSRTDYGKPFNQKQLYQKERPAKPPSGRFIGFFLIITVNVNKTTIHIGYLLR
jgi:hypothetical protein